MIRILRQLQYCLKRCRVIPMEILITEMQILNIQIIFIRLSPLPLNQDYSLGLLDEREGATDLFDISSVSTFL
ncbi:hypothetical protein NQ317_013781, partial [Molorchus minor]